MRVLVTGGAEVSVLDDLSTGHADAVRGGDFIQGDIADVAATSRLLAERGVQAVVHFAAGTCVRDYIHVTDLCVAHLRALEWLDQASYDCFNLGNGDGATVLEVIEAARRVLGWRPAHAGIETIVRDAWSFEQSRAR